MAVFCRALFASLLLSLVLLQLTAAEDYSSNNNGTARGPVAEPIDCGVACGGRCKLSSRPNLCLRACKTCCGRCQCVPPGTAGNLEACPCYANLTTGPNHVRKCP